jgi:hypothetical protein
MHSLLRRALPAAALTLAAAAPSPVAVEGWTFTWKVTAEASDGKKVERGAPPSMKVSMIPGKARIDYVDGAPMGQKKGAYMIIDAERSDFIMVSPEDKSAVVMDPSALGSMMNAMGATKLVKMDVSDVSTSVDKLGPGEKILGHSTNKYRITRDYKMDIAVFGRHNRTTHHAVSETWFATDNFIEDRTFEAWAKNLAGSFQGIGGDAFKKLMEGEAQIPKGIMMKQVTTSTDTDDKGKEKSSTMTMEMTELQKGGIDASLFKVPEGYQVTDMKAQMSALNDSLKVAKEKCEKENGKGSDKCSMSLESGADSGVKVSPKDAAKKAFKGLFKKP